MTGVRALFFRNLSMGGNPAKSGKRAKLPRRYVAEKTKSRSLDRETEEKSILIRKVKFLKVSIMLVVIDGENGE